MWVLKPFLELSLIYLFLRHSLLPSKFMICVYTLLCVFSVFSLVKCSFSKIVFPSRFIKALYVYCIKLRKCRKQKKGRENYHIPTFF